MLSTNNKMQLLATTTTTLLLLLLLLGCSIRIVSGQDMELVLVNSLTNAPIETFLPPPGMNLMYLGDVGNEITMQASPSFGAVYGSIKFLWDNSTVETDNAPPYAMAGDDAGDFHKEPLLQLTGVHTVTVRTYTEPNGAGSEALEPYSVVLDIRDGRNPISSPRQCAPGTIDRPTPVYQLSREPPTGMEEEEEPQDLIGYERSDVVAAPEPYVVPPRAECGTAVGNLAFRAGNEYRCPAYLGDPVTVVGTAGYDRVAFRFEQLWKITPITWLAVRRQDKRAVVCDTVTNFQDSIVYEADCTGDHASVEIWMQDLSFTFGREESVVATEVDDIPAICLNPAPADPTDAATERCYFTVDVPCTCGPTAAPTETRSSAPTDTHSAQPSPAPTPFPSLSPTAAHSASPSQKPSLAPTYPAPTVSPTCEPNTEADLQYEQGNEAKCMGFATGDPVDVISQNDEDGTVTFSVRQTWKPDGATMNYLAVDRIENGVWTCSYSSHVNDTQYEQGLLTYTADCDPDTQYSPIKVYARDFIFGRASTIDDGAINPQCAAPTGPKKCFFSAQVPCGCA